MKRSEMLDILQKSIIRHMNMMECCATEEEMYSHILGDLEKAGLYLVDEEYGVTGYEPEEGWDKWLEEEDRKDNARDFEIVQELTPRTLDIATKFLQGASFEDIAEEYNVTRERIRQIVAKARRKYYK